MKNLIVLIGSALFGWFMLEHIGGWIALIVIAIGLWYWSLRRGKLAVKALLYLYAIQDGQTPAEANRHVRTFTAHDLNVLAPGVKSYVQELYGGSQLAMIAKARKQGFVG